METCGRTRTVVGWKIPNDNFVGRAAVRAIGSTALRQVGGRPDEAITRASLSPDVEGSVARVRARQEIDRG